MTEVTAEAYELVEHGLIGEEDFRDFVLRIRHVSGPA